MERTYRHVYYVHSSSRLDHCQECGGEEYQNMVGSLSTYLVVEVDNDHTVLDERYQSLCQGCVDAIREFESETR